MRVYTGMRRLLLFPPYALLVLRIGLCYPSYRSGKLREDVRPGKTYGITLLLYAFLRLADCAVYADICLPSLVLCAVIDRRTAEIPDLCSLILLAASVFFVPHIPEASFAALILIPFAWLEKIGWGDVKMILSGALLLGNRLPYAGVFACVIALCACKKRPDASIAFGPYLSFGLFAVFLLEGQFIPEAGAFSLF